MTEEGAAGNIGARSIDHTNASVASQLLAPLRQGVPVALIVDDPRLPKRKRIDKPLLFITPLSVFGKPSTSVCISLQTYGCEVVDTLAGVPTMALIRLGVSAKLAGVLAEELNLVFTKGEPNHGSKK